MKPPIDFGAKDACSPAASFCRLGFFAGNQHIFPTSVFLNNKVFTADNLAFIVTTKMCVMEGHL